MHGTTPRPSSCARPTDVTRRSRPGVARRRGSSVRRRPAPHHARSQRGDPAPRWAGPSAPARAGSLSARAFGRSLTAGPYRLRPVLPASFASADAQAVAIGLVGGTDSRPALGHAGRARGSRSTGRLVFLGAVTCSSRTRPRKSPAGRPVSTHRRGGRTVRLARHRSGSHCCSALYGWHVVPLDLGPDSVLAAPGLTAASPRPRSRTPWRLAHGGSDGPQRVRRTGLAAFRARASGSHRGSSGTPAPQPPLYDGVRLVQT